MPLDYNDFDSMNMNDPSALPSGAVAAFEEVLGPWAQAPMEFRGAFIIGWFKKAEAAEGGVRPAALAGIAASNTAAWPGGYLSGNNIIETAKRHEALELLRRSLG